MLPSLRPSVPPSLRLPSVSVLRLPSVSVFHLEKGIYNALCLAATDKSKRTVHLTCTVLFDLFCVLRFYLFLNLG